MILPSLSIVVLCRNYARFVRDCLRTVFAADQPCELVFADNGSKDESVAVARAAFEDAPAHVTTKLVSLEPEVPLCPFFNAAVRASTGTFVKPISADDMLGPNFFTSFRQLVSTSAPDVGVWLAGSVMVDDGGQVLRQTYPGEPFADPVATSAQELIERHVVHNRTAPRYTTPSMFYQRQVFDDIGGYDERFRFEDRPFLFEVLKHGWTAVVHPYNNTFYRVHCGGISADPAWMAEARIPILFDHAVRAEWRNKPLALFHLARNVRVVATNRLRNRKARR